MQTHDELTNLLRQRTWDRELILWFGAESKLLPFLTNVQVEMGAALLHLRLERYLSIG